MAAFLGTWRSVSAVVAPALPARLLTAHRKGSVDDISLAELADLSVWVPVAGMRVRAAVMVSRRRHLALVGIGVLTVFRRTLLFLLGDRDDPLLPRVRRSQKTC